MAAKATRKIVCSGCGDPFHGLTPCDPKHVYRRENLERAAYVRGLLEQSTRYDARSEGLGTALTDLLSDIRHFCDANDLDFAELDRRAYGHYDAERLQAITGAEA